VAAKVTKVEMAEVLARLAQLQDPAQAGVAVRAFGAAVLNRIRLGFRLGSSPWGAPWQALKLREGQPLVNTGRLRSSITMQQTTDGVTIGTNLRQARVQQFGATIKPKNAKWLRFPGPNGFIFAKQVTIPARPFMPLTRGGDVALPAQWTASGLSAMKKALQL